MDKYLNSDNVIFNLINEMLRYVLSKPQNNWMCVLQVYLLMYRWVLNDSY
jgi:hypothetical protein